MPASLLDVRCSPGFTRYGRYPRPQRLAPLAVLDQPQGHRDDVLDLLDLLRRDRGAVLCLDTDGAGRVGRAGPGWRSPAVQRPHLGARADLARVQEQIVEIEREGHDDQIIDIFGTDL